MPKTLGEMVFELIANKPENGWSTNSITRAVMADPQSLYPYHDQATINSLANTLIVALELLEENMLRHMEEVE